jgi:hypothetical protein
MTAHKEVRFLYPLVPFLPFFAIFAFAPGPRLGARLASAVRRYASGGVLQLVYLLNLCGFLYVLVVPLSADFSIYRLIDDESRAAQGTVVAAVVSAPGRMPFRSAQLRLPFLQPKNLNLVPDVSVGDLEARRSRGEKFLGVVGVPVSPAEPAAWIRSRCEFVASSWPWWLAPRILRWERNWWELYRC